MGKYQDDVFGSITAAEGAMRELFEKSGIDIEKNRELLMKNEKLMDKHAEFNAHIVDEICYMDKELEEVVNFELLEKNPKEFEKTEAGQFIQEFRTYLKEAKLENLPKKTIKPEKVIEEMEM